MKNILLFLLLVISIAGLTQDRKTELFIPVNFQEAYKNKTRAMDGKAGHNYWQNRADYIMDIHFDPKTGILNGNESIAYFNNSPETLYKLVIHLYQNFYRKGNKRDLMINPNDEHHGIRINEIKLNGKEIDISRGSNNLNYIHNDAELWLDKPLLPGHKMNLEISWNYPVSIHTHIRSGRVDPSTWFVAYFFPRIAVFDDIDGWNDFQYAGVTEFYNDFGDFNVSITVPKNYIVWATGVLDNPERTLSEKYLDRYRKALKSDEIVQIITPEECGSRKITLNSSSITWNYRAENVTDFAFGTSDHYCWDASSLEVDPLSGRRVFIDAAYNKESEDFSQVAEVARKVISYMSFHYPGIPFPYPSETVFNGLSEMEYPMMVNDISAPDIHYMIKLTTHEIFHTYFPFYCGFNENKYGWMDEGLTSMGDFLITNATYPDENNNIIFMETYRAGAGGDMDFPLFVNSKYVKAPVYQTLSYAKAATFFMLLREYLGKEEFKKALHEFVKRWKGRHPTPYDLLFTFNDIAGEDLNWLYQPWIFEYGYVDMGIKDVSLRDTHYNVIIENFGTQPAPVRLKVEYRIGSPDTYYYDAGIWKDGKKVHPVKLMRNKPIAKITIYDDLIPDVNPENNTYHLP